MFLSHAYSHLRQTPSPTIPSHPSKPTSQSPAFSARSARIHLWPESAVQFENSKDRAEGVEAVRAVAAQYGIWIGVGFEDPVPRADRHGGKGKRRNGVILVDSDGIVMEHYKNHIVPVTESFSITPSTEPPTVHTIQIPYGFRQGRKHQYPKRPLSLTASICLDFAHPGGLLTLGERPDVILAPASTWDASIGEGMVQQARMRADEVGATLLWCDGGGSAGEGVSAVVGRGETGESVGRRSFVRTIGIPWLGGDESDDRVVAGRTLYARGGDALALSLVWALVLGAWGAGRLADTFGHEGHRATKEVMVRFNRRIRDGISWVRERIRSARERRAVASVQEPSLIEVA
ncbi:hypothetical protein BS47DRAFT_1013047 [Hydnum rufescens UP504]|uniref:CN hydrolase domain-containing protein n=1 Tax=Hydnum rufescens UP504 TaxID=1448309 RepID=A0A9P6DVU7_9AGAM|nr:hypothetical protein BS47DRAFT_1013047 [Hydnum rufescens UP504]